MKKILVVLKTEEFHSILNLLLTHYHADVIAHGPIILDTIFIQIIVIKATVLRLHKQKSRNTGALTKTLTYIWTHI